MNLNQITDLLIAALNEANAEEPRSSRELNRIQVLIGATAPSYEHRCKFDSLYADAIESASPPELVAQRILDLFESDLALLG